MVPLVCKRTADAIDKFLRGTRTVKIFHFNTTACHLHEEINGIFDGLAANASVVNFECWDCAVYDKNLESFLNVLRVNKTLVYIQVSAFLSVAQYDRITTVVRKTVLGLRLNNPHESFAVDEVIRQNVRRMNQAVEFIVSPEDFEECEYVHEFEDILDTEVFAAQLEARYPEKAELLPSLLRRARRYVVENFFKLGGVCKSEVPRCSCSGRQILNYECWRHIFSFLKLQNIRA